MFNMLGNGNALFDNGNSGKQHGDISVQTKNGYENYNLNGGILTHGSTIIAHNVMSVDEARGILMGMNGGKRY